MIDVDSHKWWRLTNITVRSTNVRAVDTIFFNNTQNIISNNPDKGFSRDWANTGTKGDRAFDTTRNIAHNKFYATPSEATEWYVGYEFTTPVNVYSVSLQMRPDMGPSFGHEWQTAVLQCSDNGEEWYYYGKIEPKIPTMDLSLVTTPVLAISSLKNISFIDLQESFNLLSTKKYTKTFSGKVTQGDLKVPVKTEVMLYDRLSKKLVHIVKSDTNGLYIFKDLDIDRDYYALAIHPTKEYNSVITDIINI